MKIGERQAHFDFFVVALAVDRHGDLAGLAHGGILLFG
jgi:hypothetical protein